MLRFKKVLHVFFLLFSIMAIGQGKSILPSSLPEYLIGSWVNDKNEHVLLISKDYIVINKELYGYNEIVTEKDKIYFTCVNNETNVNYVNIVKVNSSNLLLDEGFKVTQLTKLISSKIQSIPKAIKGNWYAQKIEIQLKNDEVLFSDNSYKIDCIASVDKVKFYIVIYFEGEYSLLYNTINDVGHYLSANFRKTIVFKKATFYQDYKNIILPILGVIMFFLGYCFVNWKIATTKKKEVAKRLFTEMQLKSIRSQMNPHFLFNALSAIQNLINKGDNEQANHYLTEFSQLMRLTLDKTEKGLVPLSEEITSIKKYLEIEKLRFPFTYKIFVDSGVNKDNIEIPAMLVQPFVENAIIHGLNEKQGEKELSVNFKVEKEQLICLVEDNGIGIKASKSRKSTDLNREKYGLKLAKERIDLINENYKTNAQISITDLVEVDNEKSGTLVTIEIPIRY